MTGVAAALVAAAGLYLGGRVAWGPEPSGPSVDYRFAGLTCDEVKSLAARIVDGGVVAVDERARLREHLDRCPHCGPAFGHLDVTPVGRESPRDRPAASMAMATILRGTPAPLAGGLRRSGGRRGVR